MLRPQRLYLLTPRLTNTNMSLSLRALAHAPGSVLSPLFSRSFSVSRLLRKRGDYIKMRQQDPDAYRQMLDKQAIHKRKYYAKPENAEKQRELSRRYAIAHRGDERKRFCQWLVKWCSRYAWFRQDLPWKSYSPIHHEDWVEHHCEGCKWTKRGGRKLWWKKIQSSSSPATATEVDSWLCTDCYVPKPADWEDAMPRGYEGLTTIEEIAKRRDELGHVA